MLRTLYANKKYLQIEPEAGATYQMNTFLPLILHNLPQISRIFHRTNIKKCGSYLRRAPADGHLCSSEFLSGIYNVRTSALHLRAGPGGVGTFSAP